MPQAKDEETAASRVRGPPASWEPQLLSVQEDGWGGFSPGSEVLSLASCGLGRPCGTHRHCIPTRWTQGLPHQSSHGVPVRATSPSSPKSTFAICSLRAHLREGRRPEWPSTVSVPGSQGPPHVGYGAAQAEEQGTKSKRSWNALETTAAFGIPLPAVQPLEGGAPAPRSLALGSAQNPPIPSPRGLDQAEVGGVIESSENEALTWAPEQ